MTKPVSILSALAVTPSGSKMPTFSLGDLSGYLQRTIGTQAEKDRNARHAKRDDLYRDGGVQYMRSVIDSVFRDETVRELRKAWVPHARFTNPLKRIVNEISTVYAEPAKRFVASTQEAYDAVLEAIGFDEQMLQLSQLLNLHRTMLVGFRVRMLPNGDREPVMDVASPADVRVVLHPNDNKLPIGWCVRASHQVTRLFDDNMTPKWTLWTDYERVSLREDMSVIAGTYVAHELGVNPWIPVTLGPVPANFWPGEEGEDLVAAHVSIWFNNILLLKEGKSATKQSVLKGDGTTVARAQASDSEVPIEAADGQSIETIDMSMDLSMFRDNGDHILEHSAQDYGMSAPVINHAGTQSAEAREMLLQPLRAIQKRQQVPWLRFEKRFVVVVAKVLHTDLPAMEFDPAGFRMEFGQSQTPLSRADRLNLFLAERTAGVDNTVDYLMETRGMGEAEALDYIDRCVMIELYRNTLMKPLQQISGSMGAPVPAAVATSESKLIALDAQESGAVPNVVAPAAPATPAPPPRPTL